MTRVSIGPRRQTLISTMYPASNSADTRKQICPIQASGPAPVVLRSQAIKTALKRITPIPASFTRSTLSPSHSQAIAAASTGNMPFIKTPAWLAGAKVMPAKAKST